MDWKTCQNHETAAARQLKSLIMPHLGIKETICEKAWSERFTTTMGWRKHTKAIRNTYINNCRINKIWLFHCLGGKKRIFAKPQGSKELFVQPESQLKPAFFRNLKTQNRLQVGSQIYEEKKGSHFTWVRTEHCRTLIASKNSEC